MQPNDKDTCSPSADAQKNEEDNGVSIFIPKAFKFDDEEEEKKQ